jgi:hypothetical protein
VSIVTLLPNSLINTSGVSVVGTGSALTAVSDSSDSTYLVGIANNGYGKFNLATTTLGSLRVKRLRIRVRNAHDTSGSGIQVGYALLYDTKAPGTSAQISMSRGATNVLEQIGPWANSGPGGQAITQTVLDRMAILVAVQGTSAWMRVHELKVDVDTNTRPVTSAVTVTGVTTTTTPDVDWTYTDADGDIQSRWRLKVFTSTQYGAAGFNADTTAATWDSGDQFGSDTNLTLPVNLVNGTTYKAYVKTAHDWPGPEGQLWWSTWVASTAFTIAVTPPVAPSFTATPDAVLPGYRMLLNVLAPVNLATANQAGLEDGTTTGWTSLTNATLSNSTTDPSEGTHSLQMLSVAAGTMNAEWSTRPAVSPSTQYTAMATMKSGAASAARTVRIGIRYYDQAGALIGTTTYGTGTTSSTSGFVTVTATVTSPATATTASVVVEVQSTGAAGETHRWDKIGLQVGANTAWTTGGEQGTATVVVERLLKVSSDRGAPGNWAHPQLASGSGFTRSTDGFYPRTTSRVASRILDGPHPAGTTAAGARMVVWRPLVGAFNALDFGLGNGAVTDDDTPPYLMPAVPGTAHTLSAYLKGTSAVNARIFVYPVDGTNTQVGAGTEVASSTAALSTTAWTRYAATITPPAGACYLRGAVELPSGSQDLDVYLTGIQVEAASAASAFMPGTGTIAPTWERVRELESTAPASPGERYLVFDHEVPPGDPVLYRARTLVDTLGSAYTTPLAVMMDPPARNLLKDPFQPENALIVNIAPDWSETQAADSAVFHPLGRDQAANGTADPIQVQDWIGGQDGSYTLSALSDLDLYRLRQIIASGRPVLIQFHEGGQRFVLIAEDRGTQRVAAGLFRIGVKTLQCARPTGLTGRIAATGSTSGGGLLAGAGYGLTPYGNDYGG